MKYEAILFDLDGTLLPMDNDKFTKEYLSMLAKAVAPYGYDKERMIPAMWRGVGAMVKNNGSMTNSDAFWNVFANSFGNRVYGDIPLFDKFYTNEFNDAVAFTSPNGKARRAVELAHEKAEKVILATNPLFPRVAVEARLSWADLSSSDFDLVTDYDNSGFCKPNPAYYLDIAGKLGFNPENSLMIGNNAGEDAEASIKAGFSAYIVTDCLICDGDMPVCQSGTFDDMLGFLENI